MLRVTHLVVHTTGIDFLTVLEAGSASSGTSRVGFSWGLSLSCGQLPSHCPHLAFSPFCLLLHRDTILIGLSPQVRWHLTLITSVKVQSTNTVTVTLGTGASTSEFCRGTIQSKNPIDTAVRHPQLLMIKAIRAELDTWLRNGRV